MIGLCDMPRRTRYLSRKAWLAKRRAEGDDGLVMCVDFCLRTPQQVSLISKRSMVFSLTPTWRNDPDYFAVERVRAARAAKQGSKQNG